jgi:uncharacterized membrane protein YqjE
VTNVDVRNRDGWVTGTRALAPNAEEASIGQLLGQLAGDFSDLVSTQVELAKVELKEEAARVGRGAGMLTGAGACAFLALSVLSLAMAWLLDDVMPRPLAFLIVGLLWTVVAGALYLSGRSQLKALQLAPQTKVALKEDVQWAKQQKS